MRQANDGTNTNPLAGIKKYTFGTMSLGANNLASIADDVKVVRAAMDAGVWFHVCNGYAGGDTFAVLNRAFDEDRTRVPHTIAKCRRDNADVFSFDIESTRSRLGLDRIDCVQVCGSAQSYYTIPSRFIADCVNNGPIWDAMREHRNAGRVGAYVLEIFSSNSRALLEMVRQDLFDGYMFYFNPFEREVGEETFSAVLESGKPILALRTLGAMRHGGGDKVDRPESLSPLFSSTLRDRMLAPIRERSGITDRLEFSFAFLFSLAQVATTIGGTRSVHHLEEFLRAADNVPSLTAESRNEVLSLHRTWFGNPSEADA